MKCNLYRMDGIQPKDVQVTFLPHFKMIKI